MIQVYLLDVTELNDNSLFERFLKEMSSFRREKVESFIRRDDKNLSLGVGILTDCFLKEYGLCEKDMEYGLTEDGKPYFVKHKDIFFNLSHSGSYAMAVVGSSEVGCDIEEITTMKEDISSLILSEDERKLNCGHLLKIWTQKESYLKMRGLGLSQDMRSFTASRIQNLIEIKLDGYYAFVCSVKRDFHDCHVIKLRDIFSKV